MYNALFSIYIDVVLLHITFDNVDIYQDKTEKKFDNNNYIKTPSRLYMYENYPVHVLTNIIVAFMCMYLVHSTKWEMGQTSLTCREGGNKHACWCTSPKKIRS